MSNYQLVAPSADLQALIDGSYPRPEAEVARELAAMRSEMVDANDRVFNALVFKRGDLRSAKAARKSVEARFENLAQELEDARNLAG